jgi:lycopene cyclase domain-containing protein
MEKYSYLLINFFTIIICFIYSFHPKIRFSRYFLSFLKACIPVALFFILWDAWFTAMGVWWFNDRYLIGIRILDLPIEEILFFICIPFSCVFTFFCLEKLTKLSVGKKSSNILAVVTIAVFALLALSFTDRIYTVLTMTVTIISIIYLQFIKKVTWLGNAYAVYGILLLPFLIVNGILTGSFIEEAIVNYNPRDFMGIRVFTIPVEDSIYGFTLFILNVSLFKYFSKDIDKPQLGR